MNDKAPAVQPPKSYYWIVGIVFLWDLSGVGAYLSTVMMTPEALAALPDAERELMENAPAWTTGAFAIAVFGGIVGTLLMLMKKAIALPVLIVALAAVAVNMFYTWFMTDAADVYGAAQAVLAVVVFAVAAFIVWYANSAKAKGWIT